MCWIVDLKGIDLIARLGPVMGYTQGLHRCTMLAHEIGLELSVTFF